MNISRSPGGVALIICCLVSVVQNSAADQITDWLPSQCQYTGEFSQTRKLQALPTPLQSVGRFLFDCEAGVIWQTQSPVSDTVVYTVGNDHFRIRKDHQAARLQGVVHINMAKMLQALMGGNTEYLLNGFSAEIKPGEKEQQSVALTLLPKSASVSRYLQQVTLSKTADTMDIALINSDKESTTILTSAVAAFTLAGLQQCHSLFGIDSVACQGLYSPQILVDSLKAKR